MSPSCRCSQNSQRSACRHTASSSISLASDDHAESFLELTGGNRRHNEDPLIVLTAAWFYADVVSENTKDLPKMAGRIGLTSYRTADLRGG